MSETRLIAGDPETAPPPVEAEEQPNPETDGTENPEAKAARPPATPEQAKEILDALVQARGGFSQEIVDQHILDLGAMYTELLAAQLPKLEVGKNEQVRMSKTAKYIEGLKAVLGKEGLTVTIDPTGTEIKVVELPTDEAKAEAKADKTGKQTAALEKARARLNSMDERQRNASPGRELAQRIAVLEGELGIKNEGRVGEQRMARTPPPQGGRGGPDRQAGPSYDEIIAKNPALAEELKKIPEGLRGPTIRMIAEMTPEEQNLLVQVSDKFLKLGNEAQKQLSSLIVKNDHIPTGPELALVVPPIDAAVQTEITDLLDTFSDQEKSLLVKFSKEMKSVVERYAENQADIAELIKNEGDPESESDKKMARGQLLMAGVDVNNPNYPGPPIPMLPAGEQAIAKLLGAFEYFSAVIGKSLGKIEPLKNLSKPERMSDANITKEKAANTEEFDALKKPVTGKRAECVKEIARIRLEITPIPPAVAPAGEALATLKTQLKDAETTLKSVDDKIVALNKRFNDLEKVQAKRAGRAPAAPRV